MRLRINSSGAQSAKASITVGTVDELVAGNGLGGMPPSFARPDDAYTATPPMR